MFVGRIREVAAAVRDGATEGSGGIDVVSIGAQAPRKSMNSRDETRVEMWRGIRVNCNQKNALQSLVFSWDAV